MKKKMNAFTLIELLAVIVILAIIALIATPIILGIVEDAKKDAFLRSVELVISTTDIDIGSKTFEDEYIYEITDGDISNLEVSVKNTMGMNGNIIYDLEGKEQYAIHNGVYCVKKTSDMSKAEISDYNGDCKLSLSTTSKCFAFSNGTITDYYDYEDNDSNKEECPRDVMIPNKINGEVVTIIGNNAFEASTEVVIDPVFGEEKTIYVNGITSIKFPNTLESIGNSAFYGARLEGELDLSNLINLKSIGGAAFLGQLYTVDGFDVPMNQITGIKLPNSIESIGARAFQGNALEGMLDLSNTKLTGIERSTFAGAYYGGMQDVVSSKITSIKLPSSITYIGESAFEYNALSGELDLSNLTNLTSIGDHAFDGTDNFGDDIGNKISTVKFPNSLESIGEYAFRNNAISGELDLSNLTNLTSIGYSAFENNDSWAKEENEISTVKFPSSLQSIGAYAFAGNVITGELDLSYLTNLTSIEDGTFEDNNISGVLDLSNLTNLTYVSGFGDNQITSVKFPNSVTTIGTNAFTSNNLSGELNLNYLTNLTTIEDSCCGTTSGTFANNQITSIKFPSSLTKIGDYAFRKNKLSGELDLSYLTNLTSIGEYSFAGDSYLGAASNQITSLKLPSNLIDIENYILEENNTLTSVTFYGRSDLTGISIDSDAWTDAWAEGYDETNGIHFVNE